MIKQGSEILYLSNADIEALELGALEVEAALEAMFAAKAAGKALMKPKLALHAPDRALFLGSPGMMDNPPYGGIKWVGVGDNAERGLPHIAGLIILSDAETGMPLAMMDARWVTATRTAAITAVAAKRLARKDSSRIGFIACGTQARANLEALKPHFPLKEVAAYSRRLSTAEAFAREVGAEGLEAKAVSDPRDAVRDQDIVITSTPVVPMVEAFLDARWLSPGAFAGMVDLGFSWHPVPMGDLDRVVTDDIAQAGSENIRFPRPYDGEVAGLVAGEVAARQTAEERTALIFAGIGLADVAVGALVYDAAIGKEAGTVLTL